MNKLTKVAIAALLAIGVSLTAGTKYEMKRITPGESKDVIFTALNYGEISPRTGRPATNYVHGYFRSNGTYVNGYWRS